MANENDTAPRDRFANDPEALWTIADGASFLCIGKRTLEGLIRSDAFLKARVIRIGRRRAVRLRRADLVEFSLRRQGAPVEKPGDRKPAA